jgi:hypothetical protein
LKKIYLITGGKGSGKSTAIARFPPPDELHKMCVFDCEDSLSDIVESNKKMGVGFGAHIRVYERFKADKDLLTQIAKGELPWVSKEHKNSLLDYYDYFINTLDKVLVQGKFKYFGLDTVETIEAAITVWVENNRSKSGWSGDRAYGRMETEGVRPIYENLMDAIGRRGVEHIILTSHLKGVWEGEGRNVKKVLNKVQAGGRISLLSRISTAMFWLMPSAGNPDGAPAAVVLKARMGKEKIVNNKWVIERPLPQRIPHFTWEDVQRYREQGCDWKNPSPGEVMTEEERQIVSEFLTDEQMKLMVLGSEIELENAKAQAMPFMGYGEAFSLETPGLPPEVVEQIVKLAGEGLKPVQIKTQLGVSIKDVLETLKGVG